MIKILIYINIDRYNYIIMILKFAIINTVQCINNYCEYKSVVANMKITFS